LSLRDVDMAAPPTLLGKGLGIHPIPIGPLISAAIPPCLAA
jgi:hypothetical protein